MKYRVLCHILVFLFCVGGSSAQTVAQDSAQVVQSTQASVQAERTAWNTIHVELLGMGGSWSVGYEGAIARYLTIRLGASVNSLGIVIPFTLNGFIGGEEHLCEVGGGVVFVGSYGQDGRTGFDAALRLGYRYQPLHGGFNFAATFTPHIFLAEYDSPHFQPWGGISLGWGF